VRGRVFARHDGECNPEDSRIHILQHEDVGLDLPVVCQQCSNPVCRMVCRPGRFQGPGDRRDDRGRGECSGCEACVFACYFSAINLRLVGTRRKAFMCDLCGGDPLCVKFCDTHAMSYSVADQAAREQKSHSMRETLFRLGRLNGNSQRSRCSTRSLKCGRLPVRQRRGSNHDHRGETCKDSTTSRSRGHEPVSGWMGTILRVDLDSRQITKEPLSPEMAHSYVGGSGLAARILWDEVGASVRPYDPENRLIYSSGRLSVRCRPPVAGQTSPARAP